jgi:hypothetical protein
MSWPAGLPIWPDVDVEQIVDELERRAELHAVLRQGLGRLLAEAAGHRAQAARGREQRAGLALDRRVVGALPALGVEQRGGLARLAVTQPGERLRRQRTLAPAQLTGGGERAGQQVVAGEHRAYVAQPCVGTGHAVPLGGLVHHVVVDEARQVQQFDDDGRPDGTFPLGLARVRGGEHEERTEALAAREDLRHRLADDRHVLGDGAHDAVGAVVEVGGETPFTGEVRDGAVGGRGQQFDGTAADGLAVGRHGDRGLDGAHPR